MVNNNYKNWLEKLLEALMNIFFLCALISTLYVLTSAFNGITRIILFVVEVTIFSIIVYFYKNKIKKILNKILLLIDKLNCKEMLLIICLLIIVLKVVYYCFYNFDATQDGDIQLYNKIANQIIETGSLRSNAISHLFGVACHLALFKYIKLPIQIGILIVFLIGTIINFFSFKSIIGKDKAFLLVLAYVLMPSSILLTFCPTHEIFLYMYLSLCLFALNRLINCDKKNRMVLYSFLIVLFSILACFVNPSGYIMWIIIGLCLVFSNIKINKKIILLICLVLAICGFNLLKTSLHINEKVTELNTYTILIHGSNPESLGEQVDRYPMRRMREYIFSNNMEMNDENLIIAARYVLFDQYKYLLTHPINLIKLLAHKFYILWSGNHYSIEMAYVYNAFGSVTYYTMLVLSALIYLFILTVGIVYKKSKSFDICVTNYKLAILGCFGVTILSIVTNKYSLYVTLFIYFLSFYRIDIDDNK